jgi:hypothetical protein
VAICRNYPNAVRKVLAVTVERANRFVEIAALRGWPERKDAQLKGECCAKSRRAALKIGSPQRLHIALLGLVSFE